MKNLLILITLAFSMNFAASQTETLITSSKWYIVKMKVGDETISMPENSKGFYLEFNDNGKSKMVDPDNTTKSKWKYNHEENSIFIGNKKNNYSISIVSITSTDFIVNMPFNGVEATVFLKSNL